MAKTKNKPERGRPLIDVLDEPPAAAVAEPPAPAPPPAEFEIVALAELHEDPANARAHGDENLSAIEASLREFGQVEPLVVQRASKKIIGGNGRFKVMKHLGWATAKVYWVDFDDMRAAALGIALNRTAELATWDAGALDSLIRQIETDNPGLQAMLAALAEQEGVAGEPAEPTPPDEFAAVDESIETEHKCPRCGYEWSGKSK